MALDIIEYRRILEILIGVAEIGNSVANTARVVSSAMTQMLMK